MVLIDGNRISARQGIKTKKGEKRVQIHKKISVFLLLGLLLTGLSSASAAPAAAPVLTLSGVVQYVDVGGGFYGIFGDDGLKYQPLNLPYKYRQEGLAVKYTAHLKEDIFTIFMWGTVVEIVNMNPAPGTATDAERTALYVMQKRLDAYNAKDLEKLQQIDMVAKDLTVEQFEQWLGNYENFTLRHLEVTRASGAEIIGQAWYTREKMTDGAKTMDLGIVRFTLDHRKEGWRLSELSSAPVPEQKLSLEELQDKAKSHYGEQDLTKLLR